MYKLVKAVTYTYFRSLQEDHPLSPWWNLYVAVFVATVSTLFFFRKRVKYFICENLYYLHTIAAVFVFLFSKFVMNSTVTFAKLKYADVLAYTRKFCGFTIEIRNESVIENHPETAIMVLNHQHMLDNVVNMYVLRKHNTPINIVAKKKSFPIWPFNVIARRTCGFVLINNDGTIDDNISEDFRNMMKISLEQKSKIVFFPEGTRNNSGTMLPFKKGAFRMAIENQLLIMPAVISPYYFINREKKIFNKGKVIIEFLEPVSTEGLTMLDINDLINKVYRKMSEKYTELRNEVSNY